MRKYTNPIAIKRQEKGLTQAQLAEMVGVKQSHISRWEKGTHQPNIESLLSLSVALECSVNELILDCEPIPKIY